MSRLKKLPVRPEQAAMLRELNARVEAAQEALGTAAKAVVVGLEETWTLKEIGADHLVLEVPDDNEEET